MNGLAFPFLRPGKADPSTPRIIRKRMICSARNDKWVGRAAPFHFPFDYAQGFG